MMNEAAQTTGILILAAGASSRLGRPKQFLEINGKTLLQHSIEVAINSDAQTVAVVLGANAAEIETQILNTGVDIFFNADWQEGIASSIRTGVSALIKKYPALETIIFMVCDQPYVDAALLNKLIEVHQTACSPIVASGYKNSLGVPALFHKKFFPALKALHGEAGAKSIILKHADEVTSVSFPAGAEDIDTEADYLRFTNATTRQP